MFEKKYSKQKVRLFFKYLANAANKIEKKTTFEEIKEIPKEIKTFKFQEKQYTIEKKVEQRLKEITPERKEEIEIKIKSFYSKNKYLPIELKLKKLKQKIKKIEKTDKKKYKFLSNKIKSCEKLLNLIKKVDIEQSLELKKF